MSQLIVSTENCRFYTCRDSFYAITVPDLWKNGWKPCFEFKKLVLATAPKLSGHLLAFLISLHQCRSNLNSSASPWISASHERIRVGLQLDTLSRQVKNAALCHLERLNLIKIKRARRGSGETHQFRVNLKEVNRQLTEFDKAQIVEGHLTDQELDKATPTHHAANPALNDIPPAEYDTPPVFYDIPPAEYDTPPVVKDDIERSINTNKDLETLIPPEAEPESEKTEGGEVIQTVAIAPDSPEASEPEAAPNSGFVLTAKSEMAGKEPEASVGAISPAPPILKKNQKSKPSVADPWFGARLRNRQGRVVSELTELGLAWVHNGGHDNNWGQAIVDEVLGKEWAQRKRWKVGDVKNYLTNCVLYREIHKVQGYAENLQSDHAAQERSRQVSEAMTHPEIIEHVRNGGAIPDDIPHVLRSKLQLIAEGVIV